MYHSMAITLDEYFVTHKRFIKGILFPFWLSHNSKEGWEALKSYIVFLKSGDEFYDDIKDQEAGRLEKCFERRMHGIQKFKDTEGIFLLKMSEVSAIVLNDASPPHKVGFQILRARGR